eukprot:scaffold1_cov402-Prasinococcus_capsulatus_cf.AAC.55
MPHRSPGNASARHQRAKKLAAAPFKWGRSRTGEGQDRNNKGYMLIRQRHPAARHARCALVWVSTLWYKGRSSS